MDHKNIVISNIMNHIGNQQLTISGEITIKNDLDDQIFVLENDIEQILDECIKRIKNRFSYLQIEKSKNLVEISLKVFCYEKFVNENKFLEDFRSFLSEILISVDNMKCQVKISGKILDCNKIQSFIFLNKGKLVEYKILKEETLDNFSPIMINKIKVYGLTIIFTLMILYTLYCWYVYIPDHDPNKLLHEVIKL